MSKNIRKKVKSQITIDNIIFSVLLIVLVSYFAFQSIYLKTDSPQVAVTTTSMVPTYQGFDLLSEGNSEYYDMLRGDLLIVENKPVQVGDTIVFKTSDDPNEVAIVHRVIAERTTEDGIKQYATKGDHNRITDLSHGGNNFNWINEEYIIGVVIYSVHNIGWFSLELQSPGIRTVLIVSMFLILIIGAIDYFSNKSKKEEDLDKDLDNLSTSSVKIKPKKVFFKFKNFRFQIKKPKTFTFFLILFLIGTFTLNGLLYFSSNNNSVSLINSNEVDFNDKINLALADTEYYNNIDKSKYFILNFKFNVTSSGILNSVSKIEMKAVYEGINSISEDYNPSYVWTIVYKFAGSKTINGALIFNTVANNTNIATIISISVYSSGVLASSVQTVSYHTTVIFSSS